MEQSNPGPCNHRGQGNCVRGLLWYFSSSASCATVRVRWFVISIWPSRLFSRMAYLRSWLLRSETRMLSDQIQGWRWIFTTSDPQGRNSAYPFWTQSNFRVLSGIYAKSSTENLLYSMLLHKVLKWVHHSVFTFSKISEVNMNIEHYSSECRRLANPDSVLQIGGQAGKVHQETTSSQADLCSANQQYFTN